MSSNQLNSENNGAVLLVKTTFWSSVATDGQDGHGLKHLKKMGLLCQV